MGGETNLGALLRTMRPELRAGRYVFTSVPRLLDPPDVVASVREDEGVSMIVEQARADDLGLAYEGVMAMITLGVHSSLQAVGLTAAVASALAREGLSCNIVAGTFHDHLFVPIELGEQAVQVLELLSGSGA